ncbi:MAG: HD domain-containing protein [Oscillospiraceae bacterium]|nr:HD domain-containing protein [Oscillospiraceae bacterium]MBQ8791047.1 HD domain-containing protein [Ruminiclostridium sp.]
MSIVNYEYIKRNKDIQTYIDHADAALSSIGYTEHSNAHVERSASIAYMVLSTLGYDERQCELARIAAYMHDIGNVVNRTDHAHSGALMAFRLLDKLGMPAEEIAVIVSAIGNHDEKTAAPVNPVAAAVIIADKSDVRRSRVRFAGSVSKDEMIDKDDIHDRVNYAVEKSDIYFSEDKKTLILDLVIDLDICSIMDYFEIFLGRMSLCRNSAKTLGVDFSVVINGSKIL